MLFRSRNSVSNGCVLSINPYGRMWDRIAAALRTKLSNYSDPGVSAGDFSGFDSSELPVIHTVILQHINDWYGKPASHPDSIARCVLFMELVNSRHLCRDVLYEWSGSLPSGHPLTSVVNNIYNHVSVRYAWWRMCEEAMRFDKFLDASDYHEQIFASFNENVAYITCGDDNIFSVKENMRDRFCLPVIAQYMSEIGLTLTSETKSSELKYDFRTIKETRFLKRSFYWDTVNLKWLAPLDLASFLDSVYWYKKSNYVSEKDSIFMNVNTALMELSQWTPEMYNRWACIVTGKQIGRAHV